jgi:magnesium transporter
MTKEELLHALKAAANAATSEAHPSFDAILRNARVQDIAEAIDGFTLAEIRSVFEQVPVDVRTDLFMELSDTVQADLARELPRAIISELFSALPDDERADLFNQLTEEARTDILPVLSSREQLNVLTLAGFGEETVGSLTSSAFVKLSSDQTASDALNTIRRSADTAETIYVGYVLDADGHLRGTVSLRDLVISDPNRRVEELATSDPVIVLADAPVTDAIELIRRYDLIALPVLSEDLAMIGIVTVDDAMDREKKISSRAITSFGASDLKGEDLDIKHSPFRKIIGVRGLWLVVLTFFGILTSTFVAAQEELLGAVIVLAAFIAPIVDMGGNTGSQSATLVIRALALGDYRVRWRDVGNVMRREVPVVLTLAIGIALLEVVLAFFSKGIGGEVLLVVGLAMGINILVGGLLGALLPFAAKKIKTDPAALSAPMITSIMDFVGVLVYFGLAYAFLSHLIV